VRAMAITREELEAGRVDLADLVEADAEPLPPVHPGEHVRDWLEGAGVTAYRLAQAMRVPLPRLAAVLAGRRAITADTAVRLGAVTGASPEFWMGLQAAYELEVARASGVGEGLARLDLGRGGREEAARPGVPS
jgi:antitoxin HigA-1